MNNKTNIRRPFFLSAALAVCLTPVLAHAQGTPGAAFEIAGIRLGMTEDEARAAIEAFDPTLEVTDVIGVYNYSDGVRQHQTPEFLDRIEALDRTKMGVKVYFSGPVGDVRVIAVTRQVDPLQNPPTVDQFRQSLVDRFGEPAGLNGPGVNPPMNIVWEEAGKPACTRMRDRTRNEVSLSVPPLQLMASVEEYFEKRRTTPIYYELPSDMARCGAVLNYDFGPTQDIVLAFTAELKDIGALVATERARNAWVSELEAEATRQRQSQGQVPRL